MRKLPKHVHCESCEARQEYSTLYDDFTEEQVTSLDKVKSCNFYKKGQALFVEGSLPRGVFCLNKGKVKVFSRGEHGKEQIIFIAREGELVGFRAMFSGEPYLVSAETLEESNICFIPKTDFLQMIDSNVSLRNKIMKELSSDLGERVRMITQLSQKTVRERLAFTLVLLDKVYFNEAINLSREDLANFVGTATETLIRLLQEMKAEKLIAIQARKISLLNKEELKNIAGK